VGGEREMSATRQLLHRRQGRAHGHLKGRQLTIGTLDRSQVGAGPCHRPMNHPIRVTPTHPARLEDYPSDDKPKTTRGSEGIDEILGPQVNNNQTSSEPMIDRSPSATDPLSGLFVDAPVSDDPSVGVPLGVPLAGARGWRTAKSMPTLSLEAGVATGVLDSNGAASPPAARSRLVPAGTFVVRRRLV
jgi:hypothetical protein